MNISGALTAEQSAEVFNFGNLIVPFIVSITCIIGFFLAFKLPKDFTPAILAREFKELDPSLDISEIEAEEPRRERGEILFVQIGLSVLSGFIFGFVWLGMLLKSLKREGARLKGVLLYLIAALVPFASIWVLLKMRGELIRVAESKGISLKISRVLIIAPAAIFCILPLNVISLSVLQHNLNKLYKAEG